MFTTPGPFVDIDTRIDIMYWYFCLTYLSNRMSRSCGVIGWNGM